MHLLTTPKEFTEANDCMVQYSLLWRVQASMPPVALEIDQVQTDHKYDVIMTKS